MPDRVDQRQRERLALDLLPQPAVVEGHEYLIAVGERVLQAGDRYVLSRGVPSVWLEVPPGWRVDTWCDALLSAGVAVAPCAQFTAGAVRPPQGVRISTGALLSMRQFGDAMRRIADVSTHPSRYRP